MRELLRRFVFSSYRGRVVVGVLCKVVEVVFDLMTPLVVARMIDEGVRGRDGGLVLRLGALLVLFALIGYGFTLVCQKMAALVSQGTGTDLRAALYRKVNELSSADVDRFGIPSLVTRVTSDVNQVQVTVALGVRQLIRWPLLALGSMVAALVIDLRLGLVFLVCTPAIGVVFWWVTSRSVPLFRAVQTKLDSIARITRESLAGVRVIRAFGQDGREEARMARAAAAQASTAIAVGRLSSLLNPATLLVMNLGVVAILWSGALRVDAGQLTQGQVMAFVNYMAQTLVSVAYVANLVVTFTRGAASAGRVMEVLDCEVTLDDAGNAEVVAATNAPAACALELEGVSFTYAGAPAPALSDISLRLRAGGTLGVIGGTGSGKTTLVSLLPRLYDVSAGELRVFGTDVRDYPFGQLRSLVSIVPQKASLVSGTIRSNLVWRDPTADDEELWAALELSQAADFVRAKPDGLDARVETGGRNFSGGQRQRLTIARALVGAPRVLVLDDAASALDFATDARLRAALSGLGDRTTCVIVSQRVSAVMGADQILVLDHGRPAGLGPHRELVASCPLYREICLSQLRPEEVGA
ncbi:ABC transporter ATP-binding protein [Olsenella sp. HMSC062G07]|uniref:ABC transporter ATP-binding protein n=1 Tax=Olsenella sp. HMSC062G07 TaxID=1739330 RepID=UPI0008A56D50|nr:ABC transporter ATP-binding protein [Olsenella sp. HMSC062G07]OFK24401.1 ATP-binding protein [Olsenella sp. HMSC062G07]